MAETFENLDNSLRDRAKENIHKSLVEAEAGKRNKRFFFLKMAQKNTRVVSVGSRARLNKTQNWSPN